MVPDKRRHAHVTVPLSLMVRRRVGGESIIKAFDREKRLLSVVLALILLLLAVFLISINIGRYPIPLEEILGILIAKLIGTTRYWPGTTVNVLFDMRLPRILAAILVGAAFAGSGAAYQGLFKNPMVSPDILGASAGACFGAALGILVSLPNLGIELAAFLFGICAVAITYFLSQALNKAMNGILILVLAGMVVGNLFTAFTAAIKFVADPNSKLPEITFWLMGGLSAVGKGDVLLLLIPFTLGIVPLLLLRWQLNVMSFGDEEALSLGVDVKKVRLAVILSSTLVTSSAVAVSGMVGWVGLIIPHLARLLVGPNYKILLPVSLIMGGAFLLLVDDVCRTIYTTEIPLSILTAVIGAPFFIYLL